MLVWVQKWEESEIGWGCRPDGYTIHVEREHIDAYVKAMRDSEAKQGWNARNVPETYLRPSGEPYQAEITDQATLGKLVVSQYGCWGPNGNTYPPPADPKVNPGGWETLSKADLAAMVPPDAKPQDKTRAQLIEMIALGERARDTLNQLDQACLGFTESE